MPLSIHHLRIPFTGKAIFLWFVRKHVDHKFGYHKIAGVSVGDFIIPMFNKTAVIWVEDL